MMMTLEIDDDVPCFCAEIVSEDEVECHFEKCTLARNDEECDFLSAYYDDFDHALIASEPPIPDDMLKTVTTEESLAYKLGDMFSQQIKARLSQGKVLPFQLATRAYSYELLKRDSKSWRRVRSRQISHIYHTIRFSPATRVGNSCITACNVSFIDQRWSLTAIPPFGFVLPVQKIKSRSGDFKLIRLFLAKGLLESISIDILGKLI